MPRSDALARRATALDPKSAEAFVALGYANMVQRRMAAAEDAFKQALALNPNQADGLHGYSQLLAALGRVKESLAMREHLQAGEQFIINYTADTAEIYWLDGDTEKAVAMLQPFRPGRTLELALVAGLGRALPRGRGGAPRNAGDELSGRDAGGGGEDSRFRAGEGRRPRGLPRIGNLSFAYMHVGAPERVLEFYEDEISGDYFQPISSTWFWHPTYAAVRKTERFKKVARDLGLVEYWRARGWPAQCRAAGATISFASERSLTEVMAGLVPATSLMGAQLCRTIGVAGTGPATTQSAMGRAARPHPSVPSLRAAGDVALAEAVAAVGDGELAVRRDRGLDLVALAVRGLFEVRDHVGRGVVRGVLVDQRQVALPDAFDARQLRHSQIRILLVGRRLRVGDRLRRERRTGRGPCAGRC